MKTLISLFVTLLITLSGFAQQGINYKAILKDTNGNVLSGTFMNVQFTIHQSTATGTIVYQEDHNYTTDANGMLILNIGTDSNPSVGVFETIDWAADLHFLQTTITYSGGTINFDATEFMAVPYAKHAKTADNVSGLEAIDEGNGIGWRLIGRDPANYGLLGDSAVDLSFSNSNTTPYGAIGDYSIAMGYGTTAYDTSTAMGASTVASGFISTAMGQSTTASGDFSTAMGQNTTASGYVSTAMGLSTTASGGQSTAMGSSTTASGSSSTAMGVSTNASGQYSTAMGQSTTASGGRSTAMGYATTASGDHSTAIGFDTTARSAYETAIGRYTTNEVPLDSINWNANDRLFVIGNGTSSSQRSNALTVLKNGTITAPSFDIAEITDPKALVTKEYLEANASASTGLEYLDETDDATDNGGWRLIGRDTANYGPIGNNAVDLSISSSPNATRGATGISSTAMGSGTIASGSSATAMGSGTVASSSVSTAMGSGTIASGSIATAMGSGTVASGNYSTSMGFNTTAPGDYSLTIGRYNVDYIPDDPFYEEGNDPIFVIGNGYKDVGDNIFKSNALTVLRDGNSIFYGEIQSPSTGNANMIPIAYGSFDGDDGTNPNDILSGTDNFTVTRAGDFTYTISVTGETLSASNTTASVTVSTNFFRTANVTYSGGNMLVHIFSSTFSKVPAPFQFIIYKE